MTSQGVFLFVDVHFFQNKNPGSGTGVLKTKLTYEREGLLHYNKRDPESFPSPRLIPIIISCEPEL